MLLVNSAAWPFTVTGLVCVEFRELLVKIIVEVLSEFNFRRLFRYHAVTVGMMALVRSIAIAGVGPDSSIIQSSAKR